MAKADYVEMFHTSIHAEFLPALTKRLHWAYKTAHARSAQLAPAQASNLRPFYRWCLVDQELAAVGKRYQMTVTEEKNDGSCYYVQVASGRIVLTASTVEKPSKIPRRALFRDTLAQDNQRFLFPELNVPPPDDTLLYAILIHYVDPEDPRAPLFANIRFPQRDCKKWAEGRIELLERYRSAASAKKTFTEVERIEDQTLSTMREDAEKNASKQDKA